MRDRFGREHTYLRLALTDRCNLRCKYCMPRTGAEWKEREELLSFEELERLVGVFAGLGISKLRLTGGEPTVRAGIADLAARLKAIAGIEALGITTNGVLLAGLAAPLRKAGVTLLNVSLDSLQRERFASITGRDLLPDVLRGIERALQLGFAALKLNVVVIAGVNDDEILDFVELARKWPVSVRFIEYMPFQGNDWSANKLVTFKTMHGAIAKSYPLSPFIAQAVTGAIAKDFAIPGFIGTVSFISPLSEEFCRSCNRLRLTATGELKTCLFTAPQVNLRDALRDGADDTELRQTIRAAVESKPLCHPPAEVLCSLSTQAMAEIGG